MAKIKLLFIALLLSFGYMNGQGIPLPEHPRPDFERSEWTNLNGKWSFKFDKDDKGLEQNWKDGKVSFNKTINVPFPWGSELSGVADEADIAWYKKEIKVDESWKGKRTFVVIGASDWETTVWLDGVKLGTHQGGYTPFSFELTDHITYGRSQQLVIRVDDVRRDFTLYGKQGYGNARGIWQTIYLEARGTQYVDALHFTPDIDNSKVVATAYLVDDAQVDQTVTVSVETESGPLNKTITIPQGSYSGSVSIDIPNQHLWSLDNPYLYDATAQLGNDVVKSYFGMRKISVKNMPGTDYPYISLNNEPIYLQLALDQSYHPEGFYTFPSDQFIKEEILRSKSIGLNGIRTHIKVEVPRKLYWADKLGLLVMSDLPNSWGEPERKMKAESEYTLREMVKRDFNHPSIFSWIVFNETWGLKHDDEYGGRYLPSTQKWVASMYYLTKSLDSTRLVEDNSICCGYGHTETDINSWHSYLPGYKWQEFLQQVSDSTYAGSGYDFEDGFYQANQPNINSECGNVWGYDGSTGDVDWSWDYHKMMNAFRDHPKIAGWLYTEHHDVINEWNGYWKFDRSEKFTGLEQIFPGMTLSDWHSQVYISTGGEISKSMKGGEQAEIPLTISVMSGENLGQQLTLKYKLTATDYLGEAHEGVEGSVQVPYQPWMQKTIDPIKVTMPDYSSVAVLTLELSDAKGKVVGRNFMHFVIDSEEELSGITTHTVSAKDFTEAEWSGKSWDVLDGKKVNGAGKGKFVYAIEVPKKSIRKAKEVYFLAELSAKELFVKDQEQYQEDQDFMKGSRVSNSSNPNSYPMTDETLYPSEIEVWVNGKKVKSMTLTDDPADHRGVLSWHNQLRDGKLREAGSYGYLVKVPLDLDMVTSALESNNNKINVELRSVNGGGIAVYGKDFGRYVLDPGIVIVD